MDAQLTPIVCSGLRTGRCFQLEGRMPARRLRATATGRPTRMPALVWTGGRFALGLGAVTGALQGEEARPTPGRAGDGACDRREARIRHSLPVEALAPDH